MRIGLLGEPATGKSSYLVALYGALVNRKVSSLALLEVKDEVGFLNRGLESLASSRRVARTAVDSDSRVAIRTDGVSGDIDIDILDRSGELLKAMLNERAWDEELFESLDDLDGVLLFLHVLRLDPGHSADEVDVLLEVEESASTAASGDGTEGPDSDPVPWSASLMPTDVRNVDLLQAIADRRKAPLPVAVVLSAWDCTTGEHESPTVWLGARAPLLSQALTSWMSELPSAIFGVSAQGYDFKLDSDAAVELREADPWDRATVVDGAGAPASLAAPILWLARAAKA